METPSHCFRPPDARVVSLTERQRTLVLSLFPPGTAVREAVYFDNYDLPCPIRVVVRTPAGAVRTVVLRTTRRGDTGIEVELLQTLARLGLPVPKVLAHSPASQGERPVTVLSFLPGTSLQALAMGSTEGLEAAQGLLVAAVDRLAGLTDALRREPVAARLPRRTLIDHLEEAATAPSRWTSMPVFRDAVTLLRPVLSGIGAPLVFTNGDYQPGNFLAQNGKLSGFLDFESAGFLDPLLGFARYPIYDLHPLNKAGFIPRLLAARGMTETDFAPRLALGCLMTLVKEIPALEDTEQDQGYRRHVLSLLRGALLSLDGAAVL